MQKIMFNDKYGLTKAVLEGRKTMTRRIISHALWDVYYRWTSGMNLSVEKSLEYLVRLSPIKVGEIVAIAQSYRSIEKEIEKEGLPLNIKDGFKKSNGWNNKMFVSAVKMPHHIKITDIKVERLQDISGDDCLREGIVKEQVYQEGQLIELYTYQGNNTPLMWKTPREAFARLIDKVSRKGTWERNSWVFAYSFELID